MLRILLVLFFVPFPVFSWQFTQPQTIDELKPNQGIHHIQMATARSLATSENALAVTWEDNHTGEPAIYISIKGMKQQSFPPALKISSGGAAFDATVIASRDQFVILWEQNKYIHACVCTFNACTPAHRLSSTPARQVSLAIDRKGNIHFVWAALLRNKFRLQTGILDINNQQISISQVKFVTPEPKQHQSFPSIAVLPAGITIAFEDREHNHTRLMTVYQPAGKDFLAAQLLNDYIETPNAKYGAGTGAMRAQLADDKNNTVAVVWLDKRYFESGYDVYAALSDDSGKSFRKDEKVQDMLGEGYPQWHANIAMNNKKQIVVAWDDPRDGTMDIWFSWRNKKGWSNDEPVPAASDEGSQSNPALAFDIQGNLHLVFTDIQTKGNNKISRLRYVSATPDTGDF